MDLNQLNQSSTPVQPGLPRPGRNRPRTPLQPSREVDWDSLPDAFLPSGNESRVHGATESPLARTQPIPLPLPQPALPSEPKRSLAAALPPLAPQPLPAGSLPRPLPRTATRPAPLTPPQPLPKPVVTAPVLEALPKPAPIPVAAPASKLPAPAQPVMARPLFVAAPVAAKPQPPIPVPVPAAVIQTIVEPVPAPVPQPVPAPATATLPVPHRTSASRPVPIAARKSGAEARSDVPDDEASGAVNPIRAAICDAIPPGVNPILASVIAPAHLVDPEDGVPERESRSPNGLLRLAVSGLVAAGLAVAAYAFYGNGFDPDGLQKTAASAERVLRKSIHSARQGWEDTRAACQILLAVAFPQQPPAGETTATPAVEREHLAGRLKTEIGGFVQNLTSRGREDWNAAKGSKR